MHGKSPFAGKTVLIVDDEPYILDLLQTGLDFVGYETLTASNGAEALRQADEHSPDLILLDVTMHEVDGLDVLENLRLRGKETPVIFVTARDSLGDRVAGLDLGADDYVTKPFSLKEVVARVEAVLRRSGASSRQLVVGDLVIDEDTREVTRGGVVVELSVTEYNVLHYLAGKAGKVVSKLELLDVVWEGNVPDDSTVVESYISYLRRKLDAHGEPLIHTSRGAGYLLRAPRPTA